MLNFRKGSNVILSLDTNNGKLNLLFAFCSVKVRGSHFSVLDDNVPLREKAFKQCDITFDMEL